MVADAELFEGSAEGGEDFGCAVAGMAFDDGEGAVGGAEEEDGFEDGVEQAREDGETFAEVEGEEVLDGGGGCGRGAGGGGFEVVVAGGVDFGAFEEGKAELGEVDGIGADDGVDVDARGVFGEEG